eukprot:TRINITY_DN17151_c0_g1_i1.p1 TRINITY_DN17151_c0_g1~~TRINITY_DN17151_c0_g1_i1.p1  ORF type:complete len:388 (+),score=69.49 TRINITY_DN17151_c0_g1_i1:47-1165(+)
MDTKSGNVDYLSSLEGSGVAELLVRLLVRSSYEDVRFILVVDALVQIAQVRGVTSDEVATYLKWDSGKGGRAGTEMVLNTLASKGIVRKADSETSKKKIHQLDYLWCFSIAEARYKYVDAELSASSDRPKTGYVCTRCDKEYTGEFVVFELIRDQSDNLYCNACRGAVEQRTLGGNEELAALQEECSSTLAIFKSILDFKKDIFIPSDAQYLTNSGDFMSHKQYRAYKEHARVKLFQSSVLNMDMSSVQKLRNAQYLNIQLMGTTKEQRVRTEVETKKRKRFTAPHFPWLGHDTDKTHVSAALEDDETTSKAPKDATVKQLGHEVLHKEDISIKKYAPRPYAFYLKQSGGDVNGDEEFVSLSQYLTEKHWPS